MTALEADFFVRQSRLGLGKNPLYHTLDFVRRINNRQLGVRMLGGKNSEHFISEALTDRIYSGKIKLYILEPLKSR